MAYVFSTTVRGPFEEVIAATTEALKDRGFGILTEIDVAATLKAKLGVDYPPYRILGACNPSMAYRALQAEPKIGAMLPCNVIARQLDDGSVEVSAVDPVASMSAVQNPDLGDIAEQVRGLLNEVIRDLSSRG